MRAWSAQLSIVAGIVIIVMGLHFLGLTRIGLLMREGGCRCQAGRPVGRLCDGAGLRVRLDAVHRPDPGGDPVGRGRRGDRDKGAGLLAVYSAGLGIPFLIAAFMVEQFSSLFARMKRHLARSSGRWAC